MSKMTKDTLNEILFFERERLATVGQLMGGIAHNLKTPLSGSVGQLMLSDKKIERLFKLFENSNIPADEYQKLINELYSHNQIIRNYLLYMDSVINTVKNQVNSQNSSNENFFSLKELLEKVLLMISFELKKNSIAFNSFIGEDVAEQNIYGDLVTLIQIILNIIDNSIDSYQGSPGKINFYANIEQDENNKKSVIISIEDFGCGIQENVKSKIFKQMFTTKGKEGTGIGLYMSNVLIKTNFEGFMEFESATTGTKMSIHFPFKEHVHT